jgi:hypothetical protein
MPFNSILQVRRFHFLHKVMRNVFSHLHVNVTAKFLTCEPNFNGTSYYIDEADQFYNNPGLWIRTHYPPNGTLPSHIICFDVLKPMISDILSR